MQPLFVSCTHDFSEELQVAKKLPLDPTVVFWLPAAPPKSCVHTKTFDPLLYLRVSFGLKAHFHGSVAPPVSISCINLGPRRGFVD